MLNNDIEPDVFFHLAQHVGVRARRDALYRRLCLGERFEEVDNAFANTDLLPLLVDVHGAWVEEENFAVGEVLFRRLVRTRGQQTGVHYENGANLDLGKQILRLCHDEKETRERIED